MQRRRHPHEGRPGGEATARQPPSPGIRAWRQLGATPVYFVFAVSGFASLAFETLWFRQAHLTFGQSVWASSLVLSSFMAGLALGNGLAARHASRLARPLVAYAVLEGVVAISGLALVWTLPAMTGALGALLRPLFDHPWLLNAARLGLGFLLLLLPATAMGATLPVMVRVLHAQRPGFGSVLGRLYGANTLGAMLGPLAVEASLIGWLGIRGAGVAVACCGLAAAGVALLLTRALPFARREPDPPASQRAPLSRRASAYLLAAAATGFTLLALEVVWFRFLQLFAHGGELAFAAMLATVLLGIGLGGTAGGAWARRDANAFRHAASLAFVAGLASIGVYWQFQSVVAPYGLEYVYAVPDIVWLTFCLTFPVCLLSGLLFTLFGMGLQRETPSDSRATGLLTLANTLGAGSGSLVAGFVLLPQLGMERSLLLLSALYGLAGLLLLGTSVPALHRPRLIGSRALALAAFAAALLLFPSGLMERSYLQTTVRRYQGALEDVERIVEGSQQTILYLRREIAGELVHHRLITDNYSMSSTSEESRRYMRLFAYWPLAMHPEATSALLISYGVGETASALTEAAQLERIDVVDTSREILESSSLLFADPAKDPLRDPRVRTFVEDGRYYLDTVEARYDIITGEPPPPKIAGVTSLYTREYFQLIHDRLNEGGFNTYWLPAHNLGEHDVKAIVRAYCDVFPDCALWSGAHLDWMLTGSRKGSPPSGLEAFARPWRDPVTGAQLRRLGIDSPALMGTLFMAGPERLERATAGVPPLVDDHPKRLQDELPGPDVARTHQHWMEVERAEQAFRESAYIRAMWPPALRARSLERFDFQALLLETFRSDGNPDLLMDLHRVLTETPYRYLARRLMGADGDVLAVVRRLVASGAPPAPYRLDLAVDALVDRRFDAAAGHIAASLRRDARSDRLWFLYVYALCMSGERDTAESVVARSSGRFARTSEGRRVRSWLAAEFGLDVRGPRPTTG